MTTTLNKIYACIVHKENKDSTEWFGKLLKFLGKTEPDDEPLKFSTIFESNGLEDALWCLRSILPDHDREIRLLAADYAERVLHLYENQHPNDNRPRLAIKAARDFANKKITKEELEIFTKNAWDASGGNFLNCANKKAAWISDGFANDAAGAAFWAAKGDAGITAWISARAINNDVGHIWNDDAITERKIQKELLIKYFGG